MSYALTESSADDILRIHITGRWPHENPRTIMNAIINLWKKNKERPLLINIQKMESHPSVLGDYEEAKQFAEAGFWEIRRIAIIDRMNRRNANSFFETTAINRGLLFRFFYEDEQEAVNWLLDQ